MSPIFQYPRGLINPTRERGRFETPPSFVGLVHRTSIVPLAVALDSRMSRSSTERDLGAAGSVHINLSRDGTRQVITGRRIWPTSIFPSRKCGAAIVCEGGNELLFATQCEVDPGVIGFASQPVRFEIIINGRRHDYHADFVRNLADGTVEVIEVKPSAEYLQKPGYLAKLDAVRALCGRMGWKFRLVFGEDLRRGSFFNFHVKQIYRHRFYRIRPNVEDAVMTHLWTTKCVLLVGDLQAYFQSYAEMLAALCALICRNVVHVDLAAEVTAATPLHIVDRRAV